MIRCRISQRLLSRNSDHPEPQQQVNDSIEEAGGGGAAAAAPSTALLRCPRLIPKSAAQNSRAGKQEQRDHWLLNLCKKTEDEVHSAEQFSFHLAMLEASGLHPVEEEPLGDDSFMEWSSSELKAEPVIQKPELRNPVLGSDMVSAIENVVSDAVDSFSEGCSYRDDSMDSIADDLLGELEKAAVQVAGMEAEIKSLKDRVEEGELRRSHLEEELAFHKEADKLAASVSLHKNSSPCTSGRHHCRHSSEQLTSYEERLAFLEDVCRNKDATIMDLEQEISSLQTKLCDLFKDEQQQQRSAASSPPATIKELLVKLGSNRAPSESRESSAKKKLVGKKPSRKSSSITSNILVDRTNTNPAKKLKF